MLELKEIISAQRVFLHIRLLIQNNRVFHIREVLFSTIYLIAILERMILYRENDLPRCIISIIKIFVLIIIINALFSISKKYWDYKGLFSYLGESSLEIYIVHMYITCGIRPILKIFHIENFWIAIITTLLGPMLLIIGFYILKKMKLWDLFFKPVTYFAGCRQCRLKQG